MINVESCYECESLNINYRFLEEEDEFILYEAICRDCGTSWIDEKEND